MDNSVVLRISTDLYYTADFLRELAAAIEDGDVENYESEHGIAEIEWPDEYFAEEE